MLRVLGVVLLILVVAGVSIVGSIYVYLSPDDPLPKIASPSSVRTISTGEIIGFQGKNDAHTWLGIPYAQPPVNDLRWRAPQPPMPWEGRREMLNYGQQCVQLPAVPDSDAGRGYVGDEDCLVLNVWAPTIGPTKIPTGPNRLPVMFWIHGGGNSVGSGGSEITEIYDGSLLATENDVIVVTINHRMGPFGWFAHPALMATATTPEDASGNFGTLDLIAALQWVQVNIENFGGDPDNVTIFGESAGGSNVLSLMASPLASGLFQRAIVQSGAFEPSTMEDAQRIGKNEFGTDQLSSRELAARLLTQAGRTGNKDAAIKMQDEMPVEELAIWLRGVSAAEMYSVVGEGFFAGMIGTPALLADGYVLPKMTKQEIFSDPANYNQVPVMLGSTRDEAKLFVAFDPNYIELTNGMPTGIKDVEAYNRDTLYGSDIWRTEGVDLIAEQISLHAPEDVFVYRFDADDWRNLGFIDLKDLLGASHAFELPFVFGYFPKPSRVLFPDSTFAEVELLSNSMMSYWSEFAHSGKPGRGRHGEEVLWEPWRNNFGSGNHIILDTEIDEGIRMEQGVLVREEIEAAWLADDSYATKEERCRSYDVVFFIAGRDESKKASMGCQ